MLLTDGLTVGRTYVFTVTAVDGIRKVTSEEVKVPFENTGEIQLINFKHCFQVGMYKYNISLGIQKYQ